MPSIRACIFDLDGVIVDTAKYHFIAWRRLANELGFDFNEEDNEKLKGVSRVDSLNLILKWGGVQLTDVEKTEWAAKKNEWYLEYVKQMPASEILEGVLPFLEDLQANNIKIVLGSASKNATTILKQIGIIDMFDAIIDGTKTTKGKPDPQVFQLGAKAVNVSPNECIVFEDAEKGVQAANAGGFHSIGVGSPEVLSHADYVISGFENLTPADIFQKIATESV